MTEANTITTATPRGGGGSNGRRNEMLYFAEHVIRGRWFSLFASFLIMCGAGATYLFGVYSKEIKSSLGYDQTTLNLLGFFKDLGENIGVLSGLIDEVSLTWFVLLIRAAMNFGGYFMIWLAVTGKISKPKVWQMCLYICIGANSQNFANTGSLVTSVKNFLESRGVVLGLLKGFTGLSDAMMTQMYLTVYGNDSKLLILLIAWLPAALSVVFVYVIREIKVVRQPSELTMVYRFLYVSIGLALFLMAVTIAEKLVAFRTWAYVEVLLIAIREELVLWKLNKLQPIVHPTILIQTPIVLELQPSPELENPKLSCYANTFFNKPIRGEDYTILFFSEILLVKYKFLRTLMMSLVLSCLGLLLIAFPFRGSVYVASVIIGFSFSAQLPLLFAIISELFGLKLYSTLFNCGELASPLGSYILNVRVTGSLYDKEALKDLAQKGLNRSAVKELICLGGC